MMKWFCFIAIVLMNVSFVRAQTPLRDAVQKKVAEELSAIKQGVAKKAFVGIITSKSDLVLTITNLGKQLRTANLTAEATILSAGKEITPKTVKEGDFVIAMGDVDSQNVMTIKRMLVVAKPLVETRQVLTGKVMKITSSLLTLEDSRAESWTVKITADTKKSTKLKEGDKVVVLGTTDKGENSLLGKIIRQVL